VGRFFCSKRYRRVMQPRPEDPRPRLYSKYETILLLEVGTQRLRINSGNFSFRPFRPHFRTSILSNFIRFSNIFHFFFPRIRSTAEQVELVEFFKDGRTLKVSRPWLKTECPSLARMRKDLYFQNEDESKPCTVYSDGRIALVSENLSGNLHC